jgi:hypothetical protein
LAIEADCPILPVTILGSVLHPVPASHAHIILARALPESTRGRYAEIPEGFEQK